MSIVLDVVQKILLHNVYELTCAAAEQVLNRCTHKAQTAIKPPCCVDEIFKLAAQKPLAGPLQQQALAPSKEQAKPQPEVKRTKRDMPRFNSGPIDPPQNSCMRLVRDSYFS